MVGHAEGEDDLGGDDDDMGDGRGVNSASIAKTRHFGSFFTTSFTARVVAILHSPGRGADAGTDTCAGVGVGAVVSCGGVVFGGGGVVVGNGAIFGSDGSRVPSRGANRLHWVGPIADSTVKPPLWRPGEGTKRLRRMGGSCMELATPWLTRLTTGGAASAAGGSAVIVAVAVAASESAAVVVVGGSMAAVVAVAVVVAADVLAVVAGMLVAAVVGVVVMAVVAAGMSVVAAGVSVMAGAAGVLVVVVAVVVAVVVVAAAGVAAAGKTGGVVSGSKSSNSSRLSSAAIRAMVQLCRAAYQKVGGCKGRGEADRQPSFACARVACAPAALSSRTRKLCSLR